MAEVLRFARRSVAKAVQKTVSGTGIEGLLDEIPHCAALTQVNKLSIKLQDEELHQEVVKKHILTGHFNFSPITFLIRDEQDKKRTVMTARLICSRGFVVQANGKDVMEVGIPNNSTTSLGKIVHPTGATIFKVVATETGKFRVQKVSSQNPRAVYMTVEKEAKAAYQLASMSGLLFEDGVYWLKSASGKAIGKMRPKFVLQQNTLIVNFDDSPADGQSRAVMLGVALLLVLSDAYPELSGVLKDSMSAAEF
uniref:Uncharacterized protein n=1 Tax=Plectus sambesii TaxID=2011161 RepID=A0A914WTR7_9BILA